MARFKYVRLLGFRNISEAEFFPHPHVNVLIGPNGAGKTNVLEALYFLSRGDSFRCHRPGPLVAHGSPSFSVFGKLDEPRSVGVGFGAGKRLARVNGNPVEKRSMLASALPVFYFGPDACDYVDDGPGVRRRFLDWGLFHVEQDYASVWQQYRKALQQRNALLRNNVSSTADYDVWNSALAEFGRRIELWQRRYVGELIPHVTAFLEVLGIPHSVTMDYFPGWRGDEGLEQLLSNSVGRDLRAGFTRAGVHVCDLIILADGRPAAAMLSRGQRKNVNIALWLARARLQAAHRGVDPVLLVDDLRSELDREQFGRVLELIIAEDAQCFFTDTDRDSWCGPRGRAGALFHVKQGKITHHQCHDKLPVTD